MTQPARCNAWLRTDTGETLGLIPFDTLAMVRDVETFDTLTMSANPNIPLLANIALDDFTDKRILVERAGVDVGQIRTENEFFIRTVITSRNSMQFTGYGAEEMLGRRIVAYAASSTDTVATLPADDLMKFVVTGNLGIGAAVDRQLPGLTVQASISAGPSMNKSFAHDNVLNLLNSVREYTRKAGSEIFFKMASNGLGGWTFKTYASLVGIDRRGIGLSLSEINENFVLDGVGFDASDEVTYMYVGGAGTEAARIIGTSTSAARVNLSAYNRREAFFNASQEKTQAGADDVAEQELSRRRAQRIFSGTIVERPNYRYGIEWDFGDILTAEQAGRAYDVMVRKVEISIDSAGERITARVEVE